MIKRYDSHLIPPTRATLSYPDINYSLPKGSAFAVAMRISAIQSQYCYYYNIFSLECHIHLFAFNDFESLLKLIRPKVRTTSTNIYYRMWFFDEPTCAQYFRSSDEAYIDMFLNYSRSINKYPDIYHRLYSKYPEYFI